MRLVVTDDSQALDASGAFWGSREGCGKAMFDIRTD